MAAPTVVPSKKAAALLEVLSGTSRALHPITEAGVTIGRHPSNTVRIAEGGASRFHCIVRRTSAGYRLSDLGSRNGTRVNGRRAESVLLKSGDVIWIGDARLRFAKMSSDVDWFPDN